MKHSLWPGVFGLLALALPVCAQSTTQPALTLPLPTDSTLSRLIEESLAARPELAQSQAVVDAQSERTAQADALPDPMLQIGIQNDGFRSVQVGRMETSFISLMAAQTLPWPGKLGLQKQTAQLGTMQARQELVRVRLSTEAEVRRAYFGLLLIRDRLALLEQLAALWQKSVVIAKVRYETASGAQSDVLRALLELNRLEQRRLGLETEAWTRVQAINRLRAHPLIEPIPTLSHIVDLPGLATLTGSFSEERSLRHSPELAAARLGRLRAERSAELAEKSYYPDFTLSAGIMYRGALPPMWLMTLGAPLPLSGKRGHAVRENLALGNAAEHAVRGIEQLLRLRSAERRRAFSLLQQTVEIYERGLLIQSQATAESTLNQYQVGKAAFASVLEANAGFIADREAHLETIAAAYDVLSAEAEISLAPTSMPSAASAGSGRMLGSLSTSNDTGSPSAAAAGDSTPSM